MEVKLGTKETMDMLELVLALAELVATEIKGDGLQWTDAIKIVMSTDFQGKLGEAISGFAEIPGEIEGLSALEGLDIAEFAIKGARSLLAKLEGAAA